MGDEWRGGGKFGGVDFCTHEAAQIKPPKTTRVRRRRTQTGHRGPNTLLAVESVSAVISLCHTATHHNVIARSNNKAFYLPTSSPPTCPVLLDGGSFKGGCIHTPSIRPKDMKLLIFNVLLLLYKKTQKIIKPMIWYQNIFI